MLTDYFNAIKAAIGIKIPIDSKLLEDYVIQQEADLAKNKTHTQVLRGKFSKPFLGVDCAIDVYEAPVDHVKRTTRHGWSIRVYDGSKIIDPVFGEIEVAKVDVIK